MVRAILFGFSGVLVDDGPLRAGLLRQVLEEASIQPPDWASGTLASTSDPRQLIESAIRATGQEADAMTAIRLGTRFSSYLRQELLTTGYPFVAGTPQLLRTASQEGVMIGILSPTPRAELVRALEQEGLLANVKVLISAEAVSGDHPSASHYRESLEAFNSRPPLPARLLHPHQVLVVESDSRSLQEAQAVGLPTLAVTPDSKASSSIRGSTIDSLANISLQQLLDSDNRESHS